MKKFAFALAALLMGSVAAHAGSAFDGLYGGLEGGYGSGKADGLGKDSSFSGGAFAGYGATHGKLYFGAEGNVGVDSGEWNTPAGGEFKRDLVYGGSARVGYLVNQKTLGYGIAGYQWADGELDGSDVSQDGLKFGVGVERFVKENVTVRTEVTYTDWNSKGAAPAADDFRTTFGIAARF